jgi:hypothetical protein
VDIQLEDTPPNGLAQADISISFDPGVLAVTACDSGDLNGTCLDNGPGGPVRAAGVANPILTGDPLTLASISFDCIGPPGSSSDLTITVNGLVDGASGAMGRVIQHGNVTCGPAVFAGQWEFGAGSVGNVVEVKFTGVPPAGLGAADINVAFDSAVLNITVCDTGDLTGTCTDNAPLGPANAAGTAAPAILVEPVIVATLTFDCIGLAGSSSSLTITINTLEDGVAAPITAVTQTGNVKCG